MYTTDDHAAILRSIPGIESIQAQVAKIEAEFDYHHDVTAKGPDPKDQDNADAWVPRSPWMNRLTGVHPFNSEAPLSLLKEHGFLTPPTLHYVRNHGVVPKLSWHTHTIDISGLVKRPMRISMAELVQLPTVTVPVTLQCAGNRRKEQNLIEKGIGFHWGCAAASTSIWTGVPLPALLDYVGMKEKDEGANWINFDGPEGEVPLGDTKYGASHSREACLNPTRPCMLAFLQNGQLLHPDHGYPVRLLMPGYIGGRMIKWVTTMSVTEQEGLNHYHIYDNRVFPKHITSKEVATKHNIWTDPAYTINDRNINSAIWAPAHCEKLSLSEETYPLAGYAYNGAGRPVHRVEVTLNGGRSWRPAAILRFERPSKYGMYYCWVHWRVEVPSAALRACGEFAVRAWDDSQNCQPERPTWNLMGMMNNPWFRVKVHAVPGEAAIWFEHPTRVEPNLKHAWDSERLYFLPDGKLPSPGWMERQREHVVEAYAPRELEDEPLDAAEGWERGVRHLLTPAKPESPRQKRASQKPAVGDVVTPAPASSSGVQAKSRL